MGLYWCLIAIPPVIVVLLSKALWPREITWHEWFYQFVGLVATTGVCVAFLAAGKYASAIDFDILNGYVVSKSSEHVTCSHEYQCGQTCTGTGKNRTCRPVYCKLHSYDIDWDVKTTVGNFTIDRVDSRGLNTPPRWDAIRIGEPASNTERVQSYLLLDQDRFKATEALKAKYRDVTLPDYPQVTDYYRFNRIVNETQWDTSGIREYLDNALKLDGRTYQLNVTVLVTERPEEYFELINEHWHGVRKNDVVLAYGIDPQGQIQWFRGMTYGEGQGNQVLLSKLATLASKQTLGLDLVVKQYEVIKSDFVRLPAKSFAYLEDSYQPNGWMVTLFLVLNTCITIVIALYMKNNELRGWVK